MGSPMQDDHQQKPAEQSVTAAQAVRTFGLGLLYGVDSYVGAHLFGERTEAHITQAAIEAGVERPAVKRTGTADRAIGRITDTSRTPILPLAGPASQSAAAQAVRAFGLGFLYGVDRYVGDHLFGKRIEAQIKQAAIEAGVEPAEVKHTASGNVATGRITITSPTPIVRIHVAPASRSPPTQDASVRSMRR